MSSRLVATLCCAALVALIAGCGGSGNPGNPQPPGNNDANNANNNQNNANNNQNNANNNANNTNNSTNNANNANNTGEPDPFAECGDGLPGCGNGQQCQSGVCVAPPGGDAEIRIGYERGSTVHPVGSPPNIGCYDAPVVLDDAIEYVRIQGEIEKFGPGGSTQGLCVTIYNGDRFLEYFQIACADVEEDDTEALEECFELDPCRCEEADDPDACFLQIGYCSAIEDAGMKATCESTFAYDGSNPARDPAIESSLIYGHMESIVPPNKPDETSVGWFGIENVPTHTSIVIKVSGRKTRWIDTYEFGPVLTNVRDEGGERIAGWGGNVISIGAWNTIPSTALVPAGIQDGNGAVAGRINDCGMAGRMINIEGTDYDIDEALPIENATVNIAHDGVRLTYFNGNPDDTLPQPSRTTTNVLAVYAALDVPHGPNTISNVGRMGGNLVHLGTRPFFLPPRSVAIVTFEGAWTPAAW